LDQAARSASDVRIYGGGLVSMTQTAPKDPEKRRNRTPQVHDWVDVPDVAYDGPELERLRPDVPWHPADLAWWEAIRTMPHCVLWNIGDWTFAAETALIVHELNSGNFSPTLIGHLTRREMAFGMTEAQRRQQRIRYVQQSTEAPVEPPVARDAGRRARLRSA
jgi:hypothetical protein